MRIAQIGYGTKNCLALLGAAALLGLPACSEREQTAPDVSHIKLFEDQRIERERGECQRNLPDLLIAHERSLAARDYASAATVLRGCAQKLNQKDLLEKWRSAAFKWHRQTINSKKSTPRDKIFSIQALAELDAHEAAKYQGQIESLKALQATLDARAAARIKKQQGVSIGMSAEDVLASSWGKPDRINRTVNSLGTREQWVYGNGHYLYFEDGILRTAQTRE